jgi:anti-anti-sigma factor
MTCAKRDIVRRRRTCSLQGPTRQQPSRLSHNPKEIVLKINERIVGTLTILDLSGKLVIDDGAELLKDKTESLIFQKRVHLIVNLAAVPYIDSGGLGQLVACYTTITRAGGRLTLLNVTAKNYDLLSITKLVSVFETFDSEREAVESYAAVMPA